MKSPVVAASLPVNSAEDIPADVPGLRAGILRLSEEQRRCAERLRALRDAEDPSRGIFHASEIHELQQDKLRMEVELEFHRRKLARLEMEEGDV